MADPFPAAPAVHDGVTIAPAPPAARFSLRTRAATGLPPILRAAPYAGGHALGLGPDEWLLILPAGTATPHIDGLHALTDVSDRNVALDIGGPKAQALLQCGIALDLALPAFPIGKVTRTLHESVEILLWRTSETAFHVEVWRSFGDHLFRALDLTAGDL